MRRQRSWRSSPTVLWLLLWLLSRQLRPFPEAPCLGADSRFFEEFCDVEQKLRFIADPADEGL